MSTHIPSLLRAVCVASGRARSPRPSGEYGVAPTPNICPAAAGRRNQQSARGGEGEGEGREGEGTRYLERGEHLALLLAVDEAVVVLHRDEGREPVRQRVVCTVRPESALEMLD